MERVGSDFDPKGSCLKISLYIATRTRAKRERWKKTKDEQAGISWDEQREKGWKDEVEEEEEEEEVDKSVERRKNRERERGIVEHDRVEERERAKRGGGPLEGYERDSSLGGR